MAICVRRGRCEVLLSVAILLCASLVSSAPTSRQVLLLHSFDASFDVFARDFRTELASQSTAPIDFLDVWLQPRLNEQSEQSIVDDLRLRFAGHHLDLIVPMGGPAVVFAQKYRQQLFPATPRLLASVALRFVQNATLTANDTAVPVTFDPSHAIKQILQLLPETTHILTVLGTAPLERFWRAELGREFQQFGDRLTFVWADDLSFRQLLELSLIHI